MSRSTNSYSTSIKKPINYIYVGGSGGGGGGGGGDSLWTALGNNIYNNNNGSVGINTSNPDISYNLDVSGSVRIRGDLIVDGSSTIIDTNILKVEDPLIQLGINNQSDLKAGGFYIDYVDASGNKKYTGMVRPPASTGYVLVNNSSIEPSDSFPTNTTDPTSFISVQKLAVNKNLGSLSTFYADISGLTRVWTDRVLIGSNAGTVAQDSNAIAIGNMAGNCNQSLNSIAIGSNSGYYFQSPNAIAIGRSAGAIAQAQNTVAMGYMAGEASQNSGAIGLGYFAGRTGQGTNSLAIGMKAGEINQGTNAIAIGNLAGNNGQSSNSIVINASGTNLSPSDPGFYVDPVRSGVSYNKSLFYNTLTKEIIYDDVSGGGGGGSLPAGQFYGEYLLFNGSSWIIDGSQNIALGYLSGQNNQSQGAVAIGYQAGNQNQDTNSIAIGTNAGRTNQHTNSIIINATGLDVSSIQANSLYISPIRPFSQTNVLGWNASTGEVSYYSTNTSTIVTDSTTFLSSSMLAKNTSSNVYATTNATLTGTGAITCLSVNTTSDVNVKTDIEELSEKYKTEFIKQLRPVQYRFKNDLKNKRFGFIAQDLEKIVDEKLSLVESDNDIKSVNYLDLIAPIVSALQNVIDRLERVERLEEKLEKESL